jgi:hypothetical protein
MTDQFDLASLRLPQNFGELGGVKRALLSVPLRKPHKHEFFRTHPDPSWCFPAPVLKMRGERRDDLFLIHADLVSAIPDDITPMMFMPTMTRQDVFLLWPLRLPAPDGRQDEWLRTALAAAEMARTSWLRMAAKQALGAYEVFQPTGTFADPVWPSLPFEEICRLAFKDHVIADLDHPALQRLRGDV